MRHVLVPMVVLLGVLFVHEARATSLCDVPTMPEGSFPADVGTFDDARLRSIEALLASYRASTDARDMALRGTALLLGAERLLWIEGDGPGAADAANTLFFSSAPFTVRAQALEVIARGDADLALRPLRLVAERRQDAWLAPLAAALLRDMRHPEASSILATLNTNYACPE